ncbi:MAG: thiamine pyrophosphate-dependent enzyme, partial [Gemmatimonadetes bacterium]|nr:thiamine pyrophosphate-dependent enzyme [Gemmatimonadota bacterium]
MDGDATALNREVVQDLLYQGFQARFLEGGAGVSAATPFGVDIRAVVMARAMRHSSDGKGDLCCPGHLSPGPLLAFGATPLEFLRQIGKKGTAPAAARSGGRSWTDLRRGLIGWDGPPGTMTQVLAGAALAFAQRGQDRAALVFEECAATETGGWHEGMNFAAAQAAPLVVVLDMARCAERAGTGALDSVGRGYGVAVAAVSDEPYAELFRTVAAARRRAVQGRGPTLIAMLPGAEADPWALHDAFVAWALAEAGVSESEVRTIERAASAGVDHAFSRLAREPEADP